MTTKEMNDIFLQIFWLLLSSDVEEPSTNCPLSDISKLSREDDD